MTENTRERESYGMRVLDIGSGAGDVAFAAARVVAIDRVCSGRRGESGTGRPGSPARTRRRTEQCLVRRRGSPRESGAGRPVRCARRAIHRADWATDILEPNGRLAAGGSRNQLGGQARGGASTAPILPLGADAAHRNDDDQTE